ncbi:MAG: WecB/TagA/CpsF family glycosyltransferase [Bacteroidales bacterium]|nr:WecB/TagA/CpsF family glycosyltransferase [Bacteroidales bacterium]
MPDGKPTQIYGRLKGDPKISNVSGYWLLRNLLKTQLSHYFYGADEETLEIMMKR